MSFRSGTLRQTQWGRRDRFEKGPADICGRLFSCAAAGKQSTHRGAVCRFAAEDARPARGRPEAVARRRGVCMQVHHCQRDATSKSAPGRQRRVSSASARRQLGVSVSVRHGSAAAAPYSHSVQGIGPFCTTHCCAVSARDRRLGSRACLRVQHPAVGPETYWRYALAS